MAFSIPKGYSKLPSEERYEILRRGMEQYGIDAVFADFTKATRLRQSTAWAHIYNADLDEIAKILPFIDCPPGTLFSRASNKCIKNTSVNRSRVEENHKRLALQSSKLLLRNESPIRNQPLIENNTRQRHISPLLTTPSITPSPRPPVVAQRPPVQSSGMPELTLTSLMLAEEAPKNLDAIQYPIYVSIKADGHRSVRASGTVLSRGLIPLPNVAIRDCLTRLLPSGFDFELIVDNSLNETAKWVRSSSKGLPQRLDVIVFDWIQPNTIQGRVPFKQRYEFIQQWARENKAKIDQYASNVGVCKGIHIMTKTHHLVQSAQELKRLMTLAIQDKQEGLMLRPPEGLYVERRSRDMMKMKEHRDSEGKIIGFNRADDGYLKSFMVEWTVPETGNSITFNISSGLNARTRKEYWETQDQLRGQYLKFSYQGAPGSEIARHAKILGVRYKEDMS